MRRKILSWRLFANRISDKKHRVESDFIIKIDYNIFLCSPSYEFTFSWFRFFTFFSMWVIENCKLQLRFAFWFWIFFLQHFSAIPRENWIEWIFIFDYNFIAIKRIVSDYLQWYCIPLYLVLRLNHKSIDQENELKSEFLLGTNWIGIHRNLIRRSTKAGLVTFNFEIWIYDWNSCDIIKVVSGEISA